MNRQIFKSILTVAVIVFLASLVFIMGISYDYFTNIQKNQLKTETELAAKGVSLSGEKYLKNLRAGNYRITWIAPDGKVLYDNEADSSKMENHLEREEVKKALDTGYGESSRYSNTLAEKHLYSAKKLSDGSVLRVSVIQMAVWTLLLGFAQPVAVVILISLILSFVLASKLARKIVAPINNIDPDNPMQYFDKEDYAEVEPLLRRIARQQAQIKKDKAEVEKASLIRQEFTANVSHELKTPMHAISGYAELIENGMVKDEDMKSFAAKIRMESARMIKLVEGIISLTKLDNGGVEMQWEDCDLYRIAKNTVDSLDAVATSMDISLSLKGEKAPVYGIPQLLYSIVYNLCDNAVKYNNPGGKVDITVKSVDNTVELSVKDNGVGIPEESQERVFERFYRVDKSRSKEVGGTGLGLSIIKHALLIHGGSISVNSKQGKGSEFIVRIPKKPDISRNNE